LEGKVGVDSLSVMYGWRDLGWWRIRRVASAVGYHPDVWPGCSGYSGNHYTSLLIYRDTVYYYWGGDRMRNDVAVSVGGNAWFLRGLLSEITGVSERGRLIASELYEVFGRVVELKVEGAVYSVSGRMVFKGRGG